MRGVAVCCAAVLVALAMVSVAYAQEAPTQTPQAGDEWVEPITGMEFVWVPGGCYEMGCGEWAGDDCDEDEYPPHEVCVDGFWMGKYEVTIGQWLRLTNPLQFTPNDNDNNPMTWVSWEDVQEFILLMQSKSLIKYDIRLPTEAEWEYACRSGGREEEYAGGDDLNAVGWYDSNSGRHEHPVGTKAPNSLGLYDMSGNAWEWVQDWFDNNQKMAKGGSWVFSANEAQCIFRSGGNHIRPDVGFRLIRID